MLISRKKAERERSEKELKDKLDKQRKELELRLGLSDDLPPPTPTMPERVNRSVRSNTRGGKGGAKFGSAIQTSKIAGGKRKRSITSSEQLISCVDGDIAQPEGENMSEDGCGVVDAGSRTKKAARTVKRGPIQDVGERDMLLEDEVDQALEELFNE